MPSKQQLIVLLCHAYAGELVAANAYAGHARSVRDPRQRAQIRRIELEEREHRARVGDMILSLGGSLPRVRDVLMGWLGWLIAASCFVGGWYLPMYGAGRIERSNVAEYERAARLAWRAGEPGLSAELLEMAKVESDHEDYFHKQVAGHCLYKWIRPWRRPATRAQIAASFAEFVGQRARLAA